MQTEQGASQSGGEVESLKSQLAAAREELQVAHRRVLENERHRAVGHLIAGLAHELSNPLTGILGMVQMVLQGSRLDEGDREILEEVRAMGSHCKEIIESLLRFARHERPTRRPVAPGAVVEEALELLRSEAESAGVRIDRDLADTAPAVLANRDQLVQSVFTVVRAAVRIAASSPAERKFVRVRLYLQEGQPAIQVRDVGSGFRVPEQLFDPFHPTREVDQELTAALSIAQGVVEEHGGTIAASNADDGGCITMTLPSAGASDAGAASDGDDSVRRALVVDDEPVILRVVKSVLSGQGIEVETTSCAQEARQRIELAKRPFDVVFLDLRMPGPYDGYALAQWILEERPSLVPGLVVMSGDRLSASYESIVEGGRVSVLPKPFNPEDVLQIVNRVVAAA